MMMNLSFVVVISTLFSLLPSVAAQDQCYLCGSASQLPLTDRLQYRLSSGETCANVYTMLPAYKSYDSVCTSKKALAQSICCNAATAVTQPAVTTVIPAYTGPVGSEPSCPICRTNEYPGIPYAFIVARYVGEFTCDQLYGRGLHGMIPSYMCGPLQDFAQSICGCGIYNPGSSTVTYSLTARTSLTAAPRTAPRAETYSSQPGARKLRGGANDEVPEPVAIPSPEDLHFETKELPADFFSTETETQA